MTPALKDEGFGSLDEAAPCGAVFFVKGGMLLLSKD